MNTLTPSFAPSKSTTSQEEVSLVFWFVSLGRSQGQFRVSRNEGMNDKRIEK
jgi:hypothetical protein